MERKFDFLRNLKDDNEKMIKIDKLKIKNFSQKNLLSKLDLFSKTKLSLLKHNLFKKINNKKLRTIQSKIASSPLNDNLFLTIAYHPKFKSENMTFYNNNNFEETKYDFFLNSAIEKIENERKRELNKVILKRIKINNSKKDIISNLYIKNHNSPKNVLSNLIQEFNKISILTKSKRETKIKYSSFFPIINKNNNINKDFKLRKFSTFNLRKNNITSTTSTDNNDDYINIFSE